MSDLSISAIVPSTAIELPPAVSEVPATPLEALVMQGHPATGAVLEPAAATAAPGLAAEAVVPRSEPPTTGASGAADAAADTGTLAWMAAQAAPRPEAMAPNPAFDRPVPRSEAAVEAGTPADAGVAPLPTDLPATVAVASLLTITPELRARTGPAPAGDDTPRPLSCVDADEDDEAADDGDGPCPDEPVRLAPPAGDPALYARLLSHLNHIAPTCPAARELLAELRRQRRIVLATPATLLPGPKCPAHVDVLWPLPNGGRAVRVAGELWWGRVPVPEAWWCAHLVKSQPDGRTRRLAPRPGDDGSRDVVVCLGPQAPDATTGAKVCLQVRDATRLWSALEPQWSVRVAVGTRPWRVLPVRTPELGHVG